MKPSTLRLMLCTAAAVALTACSEGTEAGNQVQTTDEIVVQDEMPEEANTGSATVMVGGAEMFANKNIVENASQSADHSTLVTAVKAAGLVDTLSGAGPFTVFAPTNTAFGKLPAGTVDTLVKPESQKALTDILTYHVVSGRMTAADLASAIEKGGGTATLKTVAGGSLTATKAGATITLKDAKGGTSTVTQGDVIQSNGVIHVVDAVLMPS
jgi:uncharacterized surface protein with fasciclin (FAS1) repeats